MAPAVAELEFEERPAELFLFFAAYKTDPGAYNLPLYLTFADPMNTPGLLVLASRDWHPREQCYSTSSSSALMSWMLARVILRPTVLTTSLRTCSSSTPLSWPRKRGGATRIRRS